MKIFTVLVILAVSYVANSKGMNLLFHKILKITFVIIFLLFNIEKIYNNIFGFEEGLLL